MSMALSEATKKSRTSTKNWLGLLLLVFFFYVPRLLSTSIGKEARPLA